jgi:hypothetical protein
MPCARKGTLSGVLAASGGQQLSPVLAAKRSWFRCGSTCARAPPAAGPNEGRDAFAVTASGGAFKCPTATLGPAGAEELRRRGTTEAAKSRLGAKARSDLVHLTLHGNHTLRNCAGGGLMKRSRPGRVKPGPCVRFATLLPLIYTGFISDLHLICPVPPGMPRHFTDHEAFARLLSLRPRLLCNTVTPDLHLIYNWFTPDSRLIYT